MTTTTRNLHRTLAVLAAFLLHLVVLAVLSSAAHAKGELLRRGDAVSAPNAAHERPGSNLPPLIDLTPAEVRSLGRLDGGDAFDLPDPVGIAVAFVIQVFDAPDPVRTGCGGMLGLDRGRAPPLQDSLRAA